jgi:hypothetical protein
VFFLFLEIVYAIEYAGIKVRDSRIERVALRSEKRKRRLEADTM